MKARLDSITDLIGMPEASDSDLIYYPCQGLSSTKMLITKKIHANQFQPTCVNS